MPDTDALWTEGVLERYGGDMLQYQAALLEQYKLYVEMADRISQRRGLTNTFFLTLNTTVFTAVGFFWKDRPERTAGWLTFPLIVALVQCGAWFYLVRAYRQLNGAKYAVVGRLEQRLPAAPYSRAEWQELGEGQDWRRYWPLSHIEQWVPITFAVTYVAGFVVAIAT